MSEIDDLVRRLELLEREVAGMRAAASSAPHDVPQVHLELRACTGVVNSLRQEQVAMREVLARIAGRLDARSDTGALVALREEQIALCAQVGELRVEARRGFATIDAGLTRLPDQLGRAPQA